MQELIIGLLGELLKGSDRYCHHHDHPVIEMAVLCNMTVFVSITADVWV